MIEPVDLASSMQVTHHKTRPADLPVPTRAWTPPGPSVSGLVLHLLEHHHADGRDLGTSTEASHLLAAAVRAMPEANHVVVLLGAGQARGAGTPPPQGTRSGPGVVRVGVPMGQLMLARPALRSLIPRLVRSGDCSDGVVIHAYSDEGARLARSLDRHTRGYVLLRTSREMPLPVRLTASVRPRTSRATRERLAPLPSVVDRSADRDAIRDALGISRDTCVISLACGHPQHASHAALSRWIGSSEGAARAGGMADARWFVFLGGILIAGGIDVVAIVPRGSGHLARARRFHATTRLSLRVIIAEEGMDSLLPACDLSLWHDPMSQWHRAAARGRDRLPGSFAATAAAHASGVPVVSTASQCATALYPDEARDSCVVPSGQLRHFARVIARLMSDPSRRSSLRDALRAHMAGISDDARFATTLRESHHQIENDRV